MPGIVLVFGETVAYETDRSPALWNLLFRNIIIINNPVRYEADMTDLSLHTRKLRHRNLFLQVTSVAEPTSYTGIDKVTELS